MNGNDLIEFEENNQEEIEELFLKENFNQFWKFCIDKADSPFIDLLIDFKELNQEEWNKSIEELWEYKQGE